MPNVKISELASAAALDGSEELPIVQNGVTVKSTAQEVANLSALTYTAENVVNKVQDILTNVPSSGKYPSVDAVKSYVDDTTAGLLDDRGSFSPSATSPGAFPSTGGSGAGGAVQKGDIWFLANNGFLGTTAVLSGGSVRALVNSPASAAGWDILDTNIVPLQNLQQVLAQGTTLVNGVNGQGDNAAVNNTGLYVNAFGINAGLNNQGNSCNFLGVSSGFNNQADFLNAFGQTSGANNQGTAVNAFGLSAGAGNRGNDANFFGTFSGENNINDYVNIFNGGRTTAPNQNSYGVMPQGPGGSLYSARQDFNLLTDNRTYTYPNKSGTVAMLSDVGAGVSAVTIPLSSAQIRSANTAPTELIPAPGVGKIINVVRLSYVYTFGTTTYSVQSPPIVGYKTAFSYLSVAVLNALSVNVSTYVNTAANPSLLYSVGDIENAPIYYRAGSDLFIGNGTLKITIVYSIIDL
jgi:hypothetical protein